MPLRYASVFDVKGPAGLLLAPAPRTGRRPGWIVWHTVTGSRLHRNEVFGRVEAYDNVPAAMDEIDDLERSYHQVAAVRAGGADR